MILALILLVVGVLIITPLLSYMGSGLKVGQVYEKNMDEFYAADSGIELGMWKLLNDETLVLPHQLNPYELNNADVEVTIIGPVTPTATQMETFSLSSEADTVYQITSIATTIGSDSSTTLESCVTITVGFFGGGDYEEFPQYDNLNLGDGEVHTGDVYTEGNIQLGIGSHLIGNVYSVGDTQLDIAGQITGDVYAGGNVKLYQGAVINGDVISEQNVELYEDAVINGNVCAGQNLPLYDRAAINGNAYVGDSVHLYPDATIVGDVHAVGNVQLEPGAVITGLYPLLYEGCPLWGSSSIDILTLDII